MISSAAPDTAPALWQRWVGPAPRVGQLLLSALFVGLIAATCAGVALLSRSDAVRRFSADVQIAQWQRTDGRYAYHPLSRDSGEYLLLHDLPSVDFSRGGVVYIGSSTLQHAVVTWDLPADLAPYIHNYAVESANMREQYLWVRYLVEHKGLASAGPGKTMVILGLSHLDTRDKLPGTYDSKFVDKLFGRYGLFDYDPRMGLRPKPLGAAERFIALERARASGLTQQLANDLQTAVLAPWWPTRRQASAVPDELPMRLQMETMGGPGRWQSAIDHQTAYLAMTIDYLQSHSIRVRAVILPFKRFNDRQPFARAFLDAATRLCDARNVPLTDSSHDFAEADFADQSHLSYTGQHKFSPTMLAPAVEHVRQLALPR